MHGALARRANHQAARAGDARGLPIRLKLTEGQAYDGRSAADMLDTLSPGQMLLANRAYNSDSLRRALAARGAKAYIKLLPAIGSGHRRSAQMPTLTQVH